MQDWLITSLIIVFSLIVVDIFCQQQGTVQLNKITTAAPKKWIQQNNIWIKNEQAAGSAINPTTQNIRQPGLANNKNLNTGSQPVFQHNPNPNVNSRLDLNRPINVGDNTIRQNHTSRLPQKVLGGIAANQATSSTTKPTTVANNLNGISTPKTVFSFASLFGRKSSTVSPLSSSTTPLSTPLPSNNKVDFPSAGTWNQDDLGGNLNNKDLEIISNGDATDDELREFSESLLRKDSNNGMKYVSLNLQGMTTSRSPVDNAPLPLMTIVGDAYKVESVQKLISLYNNYLLNSEENEIYTPQEKFEENAFLDAILATPIIQFARSFLIRKGKIGKDPKEFKDLLRQIWFNMYSRGKGRIGSSGFEHVFLAEIKNNQVSGLHNWLYFNEEESNGRANYLGYLKKVDLGDKGVILKYHFKFNEIDKPVGSMFIGTSPELEIALYSVCFVLRADRICPIKMNNNKFIIRTYTYRYRGKNMIGSAFPEI